MTYNFKTKFKVAASLAIILSIILLSYQNCSPVAGRVDFPSATALSDGAPFAFDIDADTFAYMSCSERPELDKNTYFTVKVGALRSGAGVFLSQAFKNYSNATQMSAATLTKTLNENKFSKDAKIQFSVRTASNLRGNPIGLGPYPGRVHTIWGSLTTTPLLTSMIASSPTNKLNVSSGALLTASVVLADSSEQAIIEAVGTSGLAVLGFQGAFYTDPSQNDYRIIGLSDVVGSNANAVYGRGYDVSFDNPVVNGSRVSQQGLKVLGTLTERKVEDASMAPLSSWNCRSVAQYRIVPASAVGSANCGGPYNDSGLSGDDLRAYQSAKALLIDSVPGSARWSIDQTHKCIVDNSSSSVQCYDSVKGPIQWAIGPTDYCGPTTGWQCPNYMSICWK